MVKYKEELQKIEKELLKVMLDTKVDKYKIIPYIARWAAELKYKEETKDLLDSERIKIAIVDVLTGKVSIEDIKKLPPLSERKKIPAITFPIGEKTSSTEKEKKETKNKK